MQINKFKKIKNNKYEVSIDNDTYKLFDEIILSEQLLLKKEITKKELDNILNLNLEYEAYFLAEKYINIKLRTSKEINTYLTKKEFSKELITKTLKKLEQNNLINAKLYLTSYINDQINLTNNGPYKILSNLTNLGFSEEEVINYLDFNLDIWPEKLNKIIDKKVKQTHKVSNNEFIRKLSNDLKNLGYDYDQINDSLKDIKIDDKPSFNKQADKYYNKYKSKYAEPKLSYYFTGKMVSLGYNQELINNYLLNIDSK